MQERRAATRINKVFRVRITAEETGDHWYVARNISPTGMFVEMAEPLPLRTKVVVRFQPPEGEAAICATAKIQNHYYFQYSQDGELRALSGVGLRFLQFVPEAGDVPPRELMH